MSFAMLGSGCCCPYYTPRVLLPCSWRMAGEAMGERQRRTMSLRSQLLMGRCPMRVHLE